MYYGPEIFLGSSSHKIFFRELQQAPPSMASFCEDNEAIAANQRILCDGLTPLPPHYKHLIINMIMSINT